MCITLPSSPRTDRKPTPNSRLWAWLIDAPLRLLSGGGLLALGPACVSLVWMPHSAIGWGWFNLLYGVMAFWLFGLLLQVYPRWLQVTPVRYARFGLIFFLLVAAQVLFYFEIGWLGHPVGFYLLFLFAAWMLTLATLRGLQVLAHRFPFRVQGIRVLLQLTVVVVLLQLAGLLSDWQELIDFTLWLGVALLLLLMLLTIPGRPGRIHTPHALH